ncbi:MAG: DEAD/DEAH box helicase [Caldimicrobium sp.]|nr:DEAD/DEAH box helicase [Caldimicrobium sp.]MDW8183518.1 DEAD/DEAH box helicase [Caldimicrobium sp.]
MSFKDLSLSREVLAGIEFLGYETPTPIQREAIPQVLSGKDLIAQAQTGTGKTAAFGIPLVERINPSIKGVQALILVPTRELALQVSEELRKLGKVKKLFVLTVYGGKPLQKHIDFLKKGLNSIVVGTPGRVKDLLGRGYLKLHKVRYLVLDEADRMLEMGFIEDIEEIISATPKDRQTLLFSATFNRVVTNLAEKFLKEDYGIIKIKPEDPTLESITQKVYQTSEKGLWEKLIRLLQAAPDSKTIIFTHTKREAESLSVGLREQGFKVEALHGDYPQKKRETILRKFREGVFYILVATDVASRGLDIRDVELVINYRLPKDSDSYIHRIGRTGRAGRKGTAISIMTDSERRYLSTILKRVKNRVEIYR